jgi:hypothetical protein
MFDANGHDRSPLRLVTQYQPPPEQTDYLMRTAADELPWTPPPVMYVRTR